MQPDSDSEHVRQRSPHQAMVVLVVVVVEVVVVVVVVVMFVVVVVEVVVVVVVVEVEAAAVVVVVVIIVEEVEVVVCNDFYLTSDGVMHHLNNIAAEFNRQVVYMRNNPDRQNTLAARQDRQEFVVSCRKVDADAVRLNYVRLVCLRRPEQRSVNNINYEELNEYGGVLEALTDLNPINILTKRSSRLKFDEDRTKIVPAKTETHTKG
ncbi:hypothetical protein DPMN_182323 [Dreissena polymorpha]|uniref:Uncharacterized protein n=1 Tax=Dreissena polymorpha TaxID=45954 RepID=A0A9D4DF87_DREPO|nr:hypothetical protein DPMN_182323 [Dreissena polymorpha]